MKALSKAPITVVLSLLTLCIFSSSYLTHAFDLNFHALEQGQLWRILTGHFTHWNTQHLGWDLFMFLVLSFAIEQRSSKAYWQLIVCSSIAISITAYLFEPYAIYRGLSGIDSALFAYLCVYCANNSKKQLLQFYAYSALLLFTGKVIIESFSNYHFFVQDMGDQVQTAPLAHGMGAMSAVFYLFFNNLRTNSSFSQKQPA